MAIVVQCPHCTQQGEVSRAAADRDVTCAGCKRHFRVPVGAGHLTVEWGVGVTGQRVLLAPPKEVRIGRAADVELGLPGGRVSRHHAAIRWEEGEWRLHDLGSANGTLVDGRPIRCVPLRDGMHFVIGDFSMRVALARAPRSAESTALDALAKQESVFGGPGVTMRPVPPAPTPSGVFGPRDAKADTAFAAPGINPPPTMDASARVRPLPPMRPVLVTPPPKRIRWPLVTMVLIMLGVIGVMWLVVLGR